MIKTTILSGCLLLALAQPTKAADFYQSYGPPGGYYDVPGTSYSYQMAEMYCDVGGCRERYRSGQGDGYYGRPYERGDGYYRRPYDGDRYGPDRGYRGDYYRGRHCVYGPGGVRVCN